MIRHHLDVNNGNYIFMVRMARCGWYWESSMNNQVFAGIAALCASMVLVPSANARYDDHDAKRDCERAISRDRGYRGARNVEVRRDGKHSYRVEGRLRMKGDDRDFYCRIRDKRVVDLYVEGDNDRYRDGYRDRGRDRGRYDDHYRNDYRERGYNDDRYRRDHGYYSDDRSYPRGDWHY